MAKVEKVEREVAKPKWEPYVTLTLSKREAAGVAALLSRASSDIASYELYRDLDRAIDDTNDYGNDLTITGSSVQAVVLNCRFGKL